MRDATVIIEPAIDINSLSRDLARGVIALQDIARKLDVNGQQGELLRRQDAEQRLANGRLLIAIKKTIGHGGWLSFLEKQGIADRTAREWMALAGFVLEGKSAAVDIAADLPTTRQVAAARRTPDADPLMQPDPPSSQQSRSTPAQEIDIDLELCRIHDKVRDFAKTIGARERRQVAHQLRETARYIEEMP